MSLYSKLRRSLGARLRLAMFQCWAAKLLWNDMRHHSALPLECYWVTANEITQRAVTQTCSALVRSELAGIIELLVHFLFRPQIRADLGSCHNTRYLVNSDPPEHACVRKHVCHLAIATAFLSPCAVCSSVPHSHPIPPSLSLV